MELVLVAAIGLNRELGYRNQLLWNLPGDLPRFKAMTMANPIIMGRKTFDSIGRPLPGRHNIVLSRSSEPVHEGVATVTSVEEALTAAQRGDGFGDGGPSDNPKAFIIGGGEIYRLFLPLANRLELTLVNDAPLADAFFPDYLSTHPQRFVETARVSNQVDGLQYDYVSYQRCAD